MRLRAPLPLIVSVAALALSPAASAEVRVTGTFNGATIPTPCVASDISFALGTGQFSFTCNGLTYQCSAPSTPPQWVTFSYSSTPATIALTCDNGTAVGLQVDIADFNGSRSYCVAASAVAYDPRARHFTYNCGTEARGCYPNTPVNFDVSNKLITVAQCSSTNPIVFADSME